MSAERIKVWQCVGCGRIDHPQPCVGICRDQKAEFVAASDYDRLEALLHRIAFTTPKQGEFESAWRAFQRDARALLLP
jgi:hypothetical protein